MPVEKKVKKVQAYPIRCKASVGNENLEIWIVKLTKIGFMAEVSDFRFRITEKVNAEFILPVMDYDISVDCSVVKVYDNYKVIQSKASADKDSKVHLVEMHFRNISLEAQVNIASFCQRIGQK